MPQTRSRKKPKLQAQRQLVDESDSGNTDGEESGGLKDIENHLNNLTDALSRVKSEFKGLRKEKQKLAEELARAQDATETTVSRKGEKTVLAVAELERTISKLRAEGRKKDRIIKKMKEKELKAEVEELQDTQPDHDPESEDEVHRMRKLLRRFDDLMVVQTLGEDDTCPICHDKLKLGKCSAFLCEHLVCNDCFKKLPPDSDENFKCAVCRGQTPRDEIELVEMSAEERWDDLLKVAAAWRSFDHRAGMETSEERDEETFLVTDKGASSDMEEDDDQSQRSGDQEGKEEDKESSEPSAPSPRSYADSPSKEKRKRLAELAEARARKKSRM